MKFAGAATLPLSLGISDGRLFSFHNSGHRAPVHALVVVLLLLQPPPRPPTPRPPRCNPPRPPTLPHHPPMPPFSRTARPSLHASRRLLSTLPDIAPAGLPPPAARRLPKSPAANLAPHKMRELSRQENLEKRQKYLAPSLRAHYANSPSGALKLRSGAGQYLYCSEGRRYLDCVNNVCHVGHTHPRVVQAAAAQLSILNTNSRYLHDNIVRLAEALAQRLPDPLQSVFFVNSGTEANDLALRLARNFTGRQDVYCVAEAYHGHSAATLAISPYSKYSPSEMPAGVVKLSQPDTYRLGLSEAEATDRALAEYRAALASGEKPPAAYIVESLMCCGGMVSLPEGYLRGMHELTRAHGGLCIADEVQTGFGRVGTHMWAFEPQGVVPDIVTVGKPFGNGFPLAAVITTPEVAEASNKFEYFNTFGGNPVACAVGLEVLSVIDDEQLQHNALQTGAYAFDLLRQVQAQQPRVGDVRGTGLLLGVELVLDRATKAPDSEGAQLVMARMKELGVLVSTDGPHRNVLKMKPPLCFNVADAEELAKVMNQALSELPPLV
ncbi:hypothetical protein AB1Y20_021974 [Prymnesium parvum]|uniref:Uncharacterized protein n=1 Tax=Prymnesium parvum TaxID=97485 RepID=A0AB34JHE4_PRYPA